jgi:hypothetical protein
MAFRTVIDSLRTDGTKDSLMADEHRHISVMELGNEVLVRFLT